MPLISIVTPFYNACSGGREEKWFRQCIESILAQTHQELEAIFVSDGSSDQSVEVAKEYARKDARVRVIENEHRGVVHTLNTGLFAARGEFIGGMSDDDYMAKDCVESLLSGFSPGVFVVGGDRVFIDKNYRIKRPALRPLTYEGLKQHAKDGECPFTHPLYRRELLNIVPGYPEGYLGAEDYAFWVRVLRAVECVGIRKEVVYIRKHDFRVSVNQRPEQIESSARIKQEANEWL